MPTEHLELPNWRSEITVPDRTVPDIAGRDIDPRRPPGHLRLYVSGPMRGIPKFGFPMFDACRDYLESLGHQAVSPADHDRLVDPTCEQRTGFAEGEFDPLSPLDYHRLMEWDLQQVIRADGIVLLPGWEDSTGAAHELNAARACGKRVFFFAPQVDGDHGVRMPAWVTEERKPTIIGISGYAQAGKDTIGSVLTESAGFLRVAFADALREVLYALNPSVVNQYGKSLVDFEWTTVQEVVDRLGWEYAKANTDTRALLQRLGTEAGRQVLGDDIWVRTAMAKVNGGKYVFTDVRFPNEAQAIKDQGGRVWRDERPGTQAVNLHASETALDDWPFDVVIVNDADIPTLRKAVLDLIG